MRREILACGLEDEVQITACGSLGLCESGPNLVVYPEGVWYSGVTPADIPELVRSHFIEDTPLERLARNDLSALRSEILNSRARMQAALRTRDSDSVLPDDLNGLVRGFQESRAVLTALELDLFTALGNGASAPAVAASLQTSPRATEMLLNALASMRILVKAEGIFRNSPAAARYFSAASPENARPALLHTAHLWPRWSTLTECVRAGSAVTRETGGDDAQGWTEAFIAAMHHNASERASVVVRTVGPENVRRMLDIGGGSGAYSIAFAQANPELRADILDRAAVEPIAKRHIRESALTGRIRVRVADLRSDALGEGYDLVFLSAICHMLSPEENVDLLRRSREALQPGGRVVIQDFILQADKTAPRFAALFALNMLVGTEGGSSYSEPEYASWLREAGFRAIRNVPLPGTTALMIGVRP
jgi:(2Fe-2S) ferredoxin/2-polyprenyl-3-methyl-5-hydroxy-6-metoxy-1,4-benzoquinol methylase